MLCNLNAEQKSAALHGCGPAMILAGPGSGKTTVIVERLRYLVLEKKVDPSKILVVTFTKVAAGQMQHRFLKSMDDIYYPVHFGTFHAVFYRILKESLTDYSHISFILEKEKCNLLKSIQKEFELLFSEFTFPCIDELIKWISIYKNIGTLNFEHEVSIDQQIFFWIYKKYNQKLKISNRIDFDDLALECLKLFYDNTKILNIWQNKFNYIMIDEFQDINGPQYEVVKLLCKKNKNIYIVGDDDQSIYSFRGANPLIMQRFLKDYPDSFTVVLSMNYRSSESIVQFSEICINDNLCRMNKALTATFKCKFPVVLKAFKNIGQEDDGICQKIEDWNLKGISYNDMAIITRTNMELERKAKVLFDRKIPFYLRKKRNSIYNHFIIKDFEAYFKLAMEKYERKYFLQIQNYNLKSIPRNFFLNTNISFTILEEQFKDDQKGYSEINKLRNQCKRIKEFTPSIAIHYIRNVMQYDQKVIFYNKVDKGIYDMIDEIKNEAKNYHSLNEWLEMIEYQREQAEHQSINEINNEGVQLLTMHSSKGLEFEKVILPDVNEGVIPQGKCLLEEMIEEERRMFYVAITRAKTELEIYYLESDGEQKKMPSRFIQKILQGHVDTSIVRCQ